jgi:hypothetical protein
MVLHSRGSREISAVGAGQVLGEAFYRPLGCGAIEQGSAS